MKTAVLCRRDVVTAERDTSLMEASRRMRSAHVGSVVIVDGARYPVGILTDRDIVLEVVAAGLDHRTITAGEIMTKPVFTVGEDDDAFDTLKVMRERGVRRVPVVTASGALSGIVSLDDMIGTLAGALHEVTGALDGERSVENWNRP